MRGRNAASTGYRIEVDRISLYDTAAGAGAPAVMQSLDPSADRGTGSAAASAPARAVVAAPVPLPAPAGLLLLALAALAAARGRRGWRRAA